jgi:kinetochore protein Nuf2
MSRNSFGGRASLGGDNTMELKVGKVKGGDAAEEAKQNYSFPMMKMADIVDCLHALGFKVTHKELTEIEHHKDLYRKILEGLVELCMGVSTEELAQPAFVGLSQLENPNLHEESVPHLNSFRAVGNLMKVSGVNDFTLKDYMNPTNKRLKKQLSGIINYAKYREEQIEVITPMLEGRNDLIDRLNKLRSENETYAAQLSELRNATKEEASLVAEKEAEIAELEKEIQKRNDVQAELREDIQELKALNNQLKESIVTRTNQVEEASAKKSKLQGQIVSSPARFKKQLKQAETELAEEEEEIPAMELKVHTYLEWVDHIEEKKKDVMKALNAMGEVQTVVHEQHELESSIETLKAEGEEKRMALSALDQNVQQVVRACNRTEDKLSHLRKQNRNKSDEAANAIKALHEEILRAEQGRTGVRQKVEEIENARVAAEREADAERAAQEQEKKDMVRSYQKLEKVVVAHLRSIRGAVDTDNIENEANCDDSVAFV